MTPFRKAVVAGFTLAIVSVALFGIAGTRRRFGPTPLIGYIGSRASSIANKTSVPFSDHSSALAGSSKGATGAETETGVGVLSREGAERSNLTFPADPKIRCQPTWDANGYFQERRGPILWSDWVCGLNGIAQDNTGASATCVVPQVPETVRNNFPGHKTPLRVKCKAPIFSSWDLRTGLLSLSSDAKCDVQPRFQAPAGPSRCAKAPEGMQMCPLDDDASLPFNGSLVITNSETVAVQCGAFVNKHIRVQPKPERAAACAALALERADSTRFQVAAAASLPPSQPVPAPGLPPPHVVLLVPDAASRHMFLRRMRETRFFLEHPPEETRVFEFSRMHMVGYDTIRNMPPMLMGCRPYNGPFINRKVPCPGGVDIRSQFMERGWITGLSANAEAMHRVITGADGSTSVLRADHTFVFQNEFGSPYDTHTPNGECPTCTYHFSAGSPPSTQCFAGKLCDVTALEHAQQVISGYREANSSAPVFSYIHLTGAHTETQASLSLVDDTLRGFLAGLDLSRTFVFMVADHGIHFNWYFRTTYGMLDHKNPMAYLLAPKRYLTPAMARALESNHQRLLTGLDVHATLRDILEMFSAPQARKRYPLPPLNWDFSGRSLFQGIPRERTCADVGIDYMDCICATWYTAVPKSKRPADAPLSQSEESAALRNLREAAADGINALVAERGLPKGACLHFSPEDFRVTSARYGERHVWQRPVVISKAEAAIKLEPRDGRVWELEIELRRDPPKGHPRVAFKALYFLDHSAASSEVRKEKADDGAVELRLKRTSMYRDERCPPRPDEYCVCAESYENK